VEFDEKKALRPYGFKKALNFIFDEYFINYIYRDPPLNSIDICALGKIFIKSISNCSHIYICMLLDFYFSDFVTSREPIFEMGWLVILEGNIKG